MQDKRKTSTTSSHHAKATGRPTPSNHEERKSSQASDKKGPVRKRLRKSKEKDLPGKRQTTVSPSALSQGEESAVSGKAKVGKAAKTNMAKGSNAKAGSKSPPKMA